MALLDMQTELRGSVSKIPMAYTKTLVNRAYKTIREANLWSFLLYESSWISPPLINAGTVAVIQGLPTITFDLVLATPALIAGATNYSLITQRQFRIGVGGIYNIIALDPAFAANGIATLDRPFADPTSAAASYSVYQLYYTPPFKDHLTWISVRNPQMFIDLGLDMTRADLDARDPQRSWYQFPTEVVPWGIDARPGSGTAGFPLYELWGQPISPFVYQCYGIRRGVDLVNPTDTLPQAIAEELVLYKAREYVYEWAEANKDMTPRSQGPDFRFLMGKVAADYQRELIKYRRQDKELCDNWLTNRGFTWASRGIGFYNSIAGIAGPYSQL